MPTTIVYLRPGLLDPTTMRRIEATLCHRHARPLYQRDAQGKITITHREPSPGEICDDCWADQRTADERELAGEYGWRTAP